MPVAIQSSLVVKCIAASAAAATMKGHHSSAAVFAFVTASVSVIGLADYAYAHTNQDSGVMQMEWVHALSFHSDKRSHDEQLYAKEIRKAAR